MLQLLANPVSTALSTRSHDGARSARPGATDDAITPWTHGTQSGVPAHMSSAGGQYPKGRPQPVSIRSIKAGPRRGMVVFVVHTVVDKSWWKKAAS
jgi:hypothetical protein